jgi:hypothetical protein
MINSQALEVGAFTWGRVQRLRGLRTFAHVPDRSLRWYLGFLAGIGMLGAIAASAQEFKPYPDAKVTVAQWQAYLDLVREKVGNSERSFPAQDFETYSNEATRTVYAFTEPGHPAHPAWITRRVVKDNKCDKCVSMEQTGFFAGDEPAFAKMFAEYQQQNERINANMHGGGAAVAPPKAATDVIEEPAGQGAIVRGLLDKFLNAYDLARGDGGWPLLSPGLQHLTSLDKWQSDRAQFLNSAGAVAGHDIDKITWYVNPPGSQAAGLYAAYDLSCRYSLLFFCGELVILYSPREGGPFTVMRHEQDFVSHESALGLCKSKDIAHVNFGNGRTFDILCAKLNGASAAPANK